MLPMPKGCRTATAALLTVAVASVALARPAAAADPVPTASLWVGSEDAVRRAADQIGVPLPPQVGVASLPAVLPFLNPADLRTDGPVGAVLFAKDGMTNWQEQLAMVVPVKPTAAAPDQLPNAAKTDTPGVVSLPDGPSVRRAGGDLWVVSNDPAVAAHLDAADGAAAVRPAADGGRTPVLLFTFDMAQFRTAAPQLFATAMAQAARQAAREPNASRRSGAEWGASLYKKLDRFSLAVDQTPAGWTTTATVTPFPAAGHGSWTRPGLPAGCAARADMQLSSATVSDLFAKLSASELANQAPNEAADIDAASRLVTAAFTGDAESMGVGMVSGQPAFYCVSQRSAAGDLAADVAAVRAAGAKVTVDDAHDNNPADYVPITYAAADGQPVYRFPQHDKGAAAAYIDVTARGGVRYATVSPSDAHLVDGLLNLKPEPGHLDALADGWVLPGKLVDVVSAFGDKKGGGTALPDEKRQRLARLFGDSRITWSAKSTGTGAAFAADLPVALLGAIRPAVEAARN